MLSINLRQRFRWNWMDVIGLHGGYMETKVSECKKARIAAGLVYSGGDGGT